MKKIFYFMMVAVMAISMASCNWFDKTEVEAPAEDTVAFMQWQTIDSTTSYINLNDSSCITLSVEDSVLVFQTEGIKSFKIVADTTELPVEQDSNTYYLQILDIADQAVKIQADSTEVDLEF